MKCGESSSISRFHHDLIVNVQGLSTWACARRLRFPWPPRSIARSQLVRLRSCWTTWSLAVGRNLSSSCLSVRSLSDLWNARWLVARRTLRSWRSISKSTFHMYVWSFVHHLRFGRFVILHWFVEFCCKFRNKDSPEFIVQEAIKGTFSQSNYALLLRADQFTQKWLICCVVNMTRFQGPLGNAWFLVEQRNAVLHRKFCGRR